MRVLATVHARSPRAPHGEPHSRRDALGNRRGGAFFSAAGAASITSAQPATQGTAAQQPSQNAGDEEEVVVTGKRPRGSVIGDIQPENVLRSRDVKATGATSFDELLVAIAPEIGVARASGAGPPAGTSQRPPRVELSRAARHSDRGDLARRHPARGGRAEIWLSARPEGRERRPSDSLQGNRRAGGGEHRVARWIYRRGWRPHPDSARQGPAHHDQSPCGQRQYPQGSQRSLLRTAI